MSRETDSRWKRALASMMSATLLLIIAFGAAQAAEPKITLKAVSSTPPDQEAISLVFRTFIDRVNKAANGELLIDYLGGPEVIPIGNQMRGLTDGVVDVIATWGAHSALVPEMELPPLSELMPWEDREVGFFDLLVKAHAPIGALPLGRSHSQDGFRFYSKTPLRSLADFAGKMSRSHAGYEPFVQSLGGVPVSMGPGEIYTALERGMIDMAPYNMYGYDFGLHEVSGYITESQFWEAGTAFIFINLGKFNGLPPNLQDLLKQTAIQMERDMIGMIADLHAEHRKKLIDAGMEFVPFDNPADDAEFRRLSQDAKWEAVEGLLGADRAAEIRNMISK